MPNLADIFGQKPAVDWLVGAYRAGRLPHGLIFAGPAGVGKATTASALATLFLCEKPRTDKPCGACGSCRAMQDGQHPDFHVIHKELIRYHDKTSKSKGTTLSIDVIRPELVEKASRKSVLGEGKVFVIEQAELMQAPAQNAMLKTLEEPAGRTLIVLLTDAPGLLLPTIRSRCQTVPFLPLDEQVVRDELIRRGSTRSSAADAAALTGGSLGLATRWLADGVIERATELIRILDDLAANRGGANLQAWFKASAEESAEKQLERDPLSSKDQGTRDSLMQYLKIAADHLRKRLGTIDDARELERFCQAIDDLVRAETLLDTNVTISLVLQQLSVALDCTLGQFHPA